MFQKPENWNELTPKQRQQIRLDIWESGAGVEFASPEAETAYKERARLIRDAFELGKKPKRVPVYSIVGVYAQRRVGLVPKDNFYDNQMEAAQAHVKFFTDLEPDASVFHFINSGPALELLDYRVTKWPGRGVPDTQSYQFNEVEFMKADEYRQFITDPTDTMLKAILPRAMPALKGLAKLPWFGSQYLPMEPMFMAFLDPEVQEALEICRKAGELFAAVAPALGLELTGPPTVGFPQMYGGISWAPFDAIGDSLRSTRGIMLDMYRRPDDVLAACEHWADMLSQDRAMKMSSSPFTFIPLHKGAMGFMSREQFAKFYWPTLKRLMLSLIEDGYIPAPFVEGNYTDRLDFLAELPEGTTAWLFDQTDMNKAVEVLGDRALIMGNVPASLTSTGTPEQMTEHSKKLIDDCAGCNNFILSNGCQIDEAKDENLIAMYDTAKTYGAY